MWSISEVSQNWSSKIRSGIIHHKSDCKSCVLPTADRNNSFTLIIKRNAKWKVAFFLGTLVLNINAKAYVSLNPQNLKGGQTRPHLYTSSLSHQYPWWGPRGPCIFSHQYTRGPKVVFITPVPFMGSTRTLHIQKRKFFFYIRMRVKISRGPKVVFFLETIDTQHNSHQYTRR